MRHLFAVVLLLISFTSSRVYAIDGIYLGGQVGHVALLGDVSRVSNNAIGFGGDIGLRTGGLLDLVLGVQHSSHGGTADVGLTNFTLTADLHVGRVQDFDFTLGVGPGFYSFSAGGVSETKFGIQFGGGADVILDEALRIGLGMKYHGVFSGNAGSGSLWTIMMRVGYLFDLNA